MLRPLLGGSMSTPLIFTRAIRRRQVCQPLRIHSLSTISVPYAHRQVNTPSKTSSAIISSPIINSRLFHSTSRKEVPVIPFLAGMLKVSTAIGLAQTITRVALTFVPVILIKNLRSHKILRYTHNKPEFQGKKDILLRRIRMGNMLFRVLVFTPIFIFWVALIASLERTPLTGRWRLILLSPEEEDEISSQLAGPGWYEAVGDILSQDEPPILLPSDDWRFEWVRNTLRRLESAVPALQYKDIVSPSWLERDAGDNLFPPPAEYPLRPRPRGAEYLRRFCEAVTARTVQPSPHAIPGPPYSLIVVDKPDSSNAFSYGFGPDGAGGIVVYSGFLHDVLSKLPRETQYDTRTGLSASEHESWLTYVLGVFSPLFRTPPSTHSIPTPEQTTELAVLLSHELAHLILAHHLETLSSSNIVIPGISSMLADVVRALLFPVTMLFGPFVNDAVANIGKMGSGGLAKVGEYCNSSTQEIEADVVSIRLLAHAGFDPQYAISFWESRTDAPETAECSATMAERRAKEAHARTNYSRLTMLMTGSSHPQNEVRVKKLKQELERWSQERRKSREAKLGDAGGDATSMA